MPNALKAPLLKLLHSHLRHFLVSSLCFSAQDGDKNRIKLCLEPSGPSKPTIQSVFKILPVAKKTGQRSETPILGYPMVRFAIF
jgi:hypothetical protein